MSERTEAEDKICIKGIKNNGDEGSRLQILKGSANCESYDCDEIHNISSKNFIVQSEDTKMCDLLPSEACGPSILNVMYIERKRVS